MNYLNKYYEYENKYLSRFATFSQGVHNRKKEEKPDFFRSDFQHDRDRIIHSRAFRRLQHKTQVFIDPQNDHYRTRLTHTLEVMQISCVVARCLRLNEDLTEAISLGHDIGHAPFGHAGETALDKILSKHGLSFKHNLQSVRIVDELENNGQGLNLTYEVRNGIASHSGDLIAKTLEGQIVKWADRIAYLSHDIEDARRANIIDKLPEFILDKFGDKKSNMIDLMTMDLIQNSFGKNKIEPSEDMQKYISEIKKYMFQNVYVCSKAKLEEPKAIKMLTMLFEFYYDNFELLPPYIKKLESNKYRKIADYIATMSDRFAILKFNEYFTPQGFKEFEQREH